MKLREQVPPIPSGHLDFTRIGASDVPAILGVDKYKSAHDVFLRLTNDEGRLEHDAPERLKEAAAWGHRTEPLTAVALCERLGLEIDDLRKGESRVLEACEWARVSPDYLLADGSNGLIECKLISARRFDSESWGDDGSDEVPARIKAQVYFQLQALKMEPEYWKEQGVDAEALEGAHVGVCVGGQRLRHYWLPWDPKLGAYLRSTCEALWFEHVLEGIPPDADGSEGCAKALALMASPEAPQRAATEEEREILEEVLEAKEAVDAAKARVLESENRLKALIGRENGGIVAGDLKASWTQRKGSTSWQAVAKEIAARTDSESLLETLKAELVGRPSRYLRTSRRKAKKS